MVYSKKTIYLSNKIIWYKFKIKHKHFRFEIFLSQNLIIKLRNNGNIQPKSAERKSYNF